jgi:hypothetical protein
VGDKWIHEIKFDGYRVQIHLIESKVKIFTRNGHDWTNRFHLIAESFDILVERAIFDGEVVVIKDGRTNFSELQAALELPHRPDFRGRNVFTRPRPGKDIRLHALQCIYVNCLAIGVVCPITTMRAILKRYLLVRIDPRA